MPSASTIHTMMDYPLTLTALLKHAVRGAPPIKTGCSVLWEFLKVRLEEA
jgi:hypothetical protein